MFNSKKYIFIAFTLFFVKSYTQEIYSKENIAIEGYDTVSFFNDEKAVKGNQEYSTEWKNTTWLFSNQENLEIFIKSPENYAPQFGGYCAWGVREGYKAPANPGEAWTVYNDKLYLNYNEAVMKGWLEEKKKNISIAKGNWVDILNDEYED